MKHLAGLLGFLLAVTALGCSGQSRAKTPDELFASMALDLSRSMEQGVADAPAVGTATLTSAELPAAAPSEPLPPMALPDERMSLSGVTPEAVDGIPTTREAE